MDVFTKTAIEVIKKGNCDHSIDFNDNETSDTIFNKIKKETIYEETTLFGFYNEDEKHDEIQDLVKYAYSYCCLHLVGEADTIKLLNEQYNKNPSLEHRVMLINHIKNVVLINFTNILIRNIESKYNIKIEKCGTIEQMIFEIDIYISYLENIKFIQKGANYVIKNFTNFNLL